MLSVRSWKRLTLGALTLTLAWPVLAAPKKGNTEPTARQFTFTYEFEIPPVKRGEGPLEVFVPVATTDSRQKIKSLAIEGSDPAFVSLGKQAVESEYGNEFWHVSAPDTSGKPITVKFTYEAERMPSQVDYAKVKDEPELSPKEAKDLALYLKPNELVPTSGALIDKILKDLPMKGKTPIERAKLVYNYVIDNMEYKKVGAGWGNGDTYWACSKKYGNCTDFHALFSSLARSERIPSRFEIGFPIPEDRPEGDVAGYHCWVMAYLPKIGWLPIDASEAKQNPEKRDFYFGGQPANRIKFSVGRDLRLGKGHTTRPLNYFIYPHIEIKGKRVAKVKTKFHYQIKNRAH